MTKQRGSEEERRGEVIRYDTTPKLGLEAGGRCQE